MRKRCENCGKVKDDVQNYCGSYYCQECYWEMKFYEDQENDYEDFVGGLD